MVKQNWWDVRFTKEKPGEHAKITVSNYWGKTRANQSIAQKEDKNKHGSVPQGMPPKGKSNDAVFAKRAAIAYDLNKDLLQQYGPLVVRQWSESKDAGRSKTIVTNDGKIRSGGKTKGSINWQMLIEPDGTVYHINKNRTRGEEVTGELRDKIDEALAYREAKNDE